MGGDPGLNVCYFFKIVYIDLDPLMKNMNSDLPKCKYVVYYVENKFGRLLAEFLFDVDDSIHKVPPKYMEN